MQSDDRLTRAGEIADRLARGATVLDGEFDHLLLPRWRDASPVHWSPLSVCLLAAKFLGASGGKVLDIGSGAGKFCVAGSLATGATLHGVEQVESLVVQARALREMTVAKAEFTAADAFAVDWSSFSGFYYYNSFEEYNFEGEDRLHESIPTSRELYDRNVRATWARFAFMPAGTRVATYHGLGTEMPKSYRLVGSCEPAGSSVLRFWIQE